MALKRRTKVNASFSMSSMTDIVFLLLIFFMVTSTLVHPNALKLIMPRKAEQKTQIANTYVSVRISTAGNIFVQGKRTTRDEVLNAITAEMKDSKDAFVSLTTDKGVTTKDAVFLLDLAKRNNIKIALNIK